MISYTIFSPLGTILGQSECEEGTLLGPNGVYGSFSSSTHYIRPVDKEPVRKPPKPSEFHVFDYVQKHWVADPVAAWKVVKHKRDQLLDATDWVIIRANETGGVISPVWLDYRQALRDITLQSDPWNIIWPTSP